MTEKILIFDSSSLITLSMNGLTYVLEEMKKNFNGKFIIPEDVKFETIDKPIKIKRFELGALKIKYLLEKNILELPSSLNIRKEEITEKENKILEIANNSYFAKDNYLHIIDKGEASCLALSLIAEERRIKNLIIVDERTTRLIAENPENLRRIFEDKFHTKVKLKDNFNLISKIKFIRSSELIYVAYKKGLVKLGNHELLDALLYAVKFKGCAISEQEIEDIKRIK